MSAQSIPTILPSLATVPQASAVYPEDFYTGGSYVELPYGRTRYWLLGPETGRKVVLIHGLSIPSIVWKDMAPQLAERGYRVLLYDLYGRGYSDAPQTPNTARFFADQFSLLMQHLNWAKAILIGNSMGGAVAAAVIYHFPHLVEDHIVLIAPAGITRLTELPPGLENSTSEYGPSYRSCSSCMSKALSSNVDLTSRGKTISLPHSDPTSEILDIQSTHLEGFNSAISSSYEGRVRCARWHMHISRTLLMVTRFYTVHGTNDRVVAYAVASNIPTLLPDEAHVELVTIEGAGHDLTISQAKLVLEELDRFLPGPTVQD
ncbi:Alpha/Beta hydrolase protein [Armillaria novae-zelandiae]|uniref:Alpha/Beta hydrolase protein n=1 Tax=Armillaria novae-zelandiae TaxID=153914 RepID=A0AA39PX19_9AGAR|nr:Alpha/Beta hydrolase protein [Armillaria novae-zelandiae]